MSERPSRRRRLRLRRKRKGETFESKASAGVDIVDAVPNALIDDVGELGGQVVGHMGCCVVEAVGSMAVLLALLTVPAYLMLH